MCFSIGKNESSASRVHKEEERIPLCVARLILQSPHFAQSMVHAYTPSVVSNRIGMNHDPLKIKDPARIVLLSPQTCFLLLYLEDNKVVFGYTRM